MKKCDMCKNYFDTIYFCKNSRNKDGLHTTCKSCKKKLDYNYRIKNTEKIKIKKKKYYLKNKEAICKKTCAYSLANREKANVWSTKSRNKLKKQIFYHYCKGEIKCQGCQKVNNIDLLTIDHINGKGGEHRRKEKIKTGYSTYQWLKKNKLPEGFQVLCWNCQYRKRKKEMSPANPTKRQIQQALNTQKRKKECMDNYGCFCSCGEKDLVTLTLDHVNDDGAKHRRDTGYYGTGFYLYLIRNKFPNDPPLQVLCLNCQYIKRTEKQNEKRKNK